MSNKRHFENLHNDHKIKGLDDIELVESFFSYLLEHTTLLSSPESIEEINQVAQRYCMQGLMEAGYDLNEDDSDEGCGNNNNDNNEKDKKEFENIIKNGKSDIIRYSFEDIQDIARNQVVTNRYLPSDLIQEEETIGITEKVKDDNVNTISHPVQPTQEDNMQKLLHKDDDVTIKPTKQAGAIIPATFLMEENFTQNEPKNESSHLYYFKPGYEWSQTFTEIFISIPICNIILKIFDIIIINNYNQFSCLFSGQEQQRYVNSIQNHSIFQILLQNDNYETIIVKPFFNLFIQTKEFSSLQPKLQDLLIWYYIHHLGKLDIITELPFEYTQRQESLQGEFLVKKKKNQQYQQHQQQNHNNNNNNDNKNNKKENGNLLPMDMEHFGILLLRYIDINITPPHYSTPFDSLSTLTIYIKERKGGKNESNEDNYSNNSNNHNNAIFLTPIFIDTIYQPIQYDTLISSTHYDKKYNNVNSIQCDYCCKGDDQIKTINIINNLNAHNDNNNNNAANSLQTNTINKYNQLCSTLLGSIRIEFVKKQPLSEIEQKQKKKEIDLFLQNNQHLNQNNDNNDNNSQQIQIPQILYWWDRCFISQKYPIDLSSLNLEINNLDGVDVATRELIYQTFQNSTLSSNQSNNSHHSSAISSHPLQSSLSSSPSSLSSNINDLNNSNTNLHHHNQCNEITINNTQIHKRNTPYIASLHDKQIQLKRIQDSHPNLIDFSGVNLVTGIGKGVIQGENDKKD